MNRDAEIAYAAGLFEGEGTVGPFGGKRHPRMSIHMTDREPLELIQRILGGTLRGPYPKAGNRKPQWAWRLNGWTDIEQAYALIGEWLSPRRREQFERTLAEVPPMDRRGQWGWSRAPKEPRTHCAHGHELAGGNLYMRRSGRRDCRTCLRTRSSAYRARRKAAA